MHTDCCLRVAAYERVVHLRGRVYPVIVKSWRTNWSRIVPMFGYPGEIRRAVYTTKRDWSGAMNQLAIIFEGRVPMGGIDQNSFTQSV
jgi:transposase-like protein